MKAQPYPSLADVESARRRLNGGIRQTPCLPVPALSTLAGVTLRLKRDDLQRTGSAKERGARHALLCLTLAERHRGVIAASAGNHAIGLAYHGSMLGIPVTVVLPTGTAAVKVARCRSLGANVVVHGANYPEARAHAEVLAARTGGTLVHATNHAAVIAGQGTMVLEILEQSPELDTLLVPAGGGLPAAAAAVLKSLKPSAHLVAVGPASSTPDCADAADAYVTVSAMEITGAINLLACRAGIVAETAGAAPLAALLSGRVKFALGSCVVLPVSGRNIDPRRHASAVAAGAEWVEQLAMVRM
jgi:threonine dehydratase